jgi:hypothetical protein
LNKPLHRSPRFQKLVRKSQHLPRRTRSVEDSTLVLDARGNCIRQRLACQDSEHRFPLLLPTTYSGELRHHLSRSSLPQRDFESIYFLPAQGTPHRPTPHTYDTIIRCLEDLPTITRLTTGTRRPPRNISDSNSRPQPGRPRRTFAVRCRVPSTRIRLVRQLALRITDQGVLPTSPYSGRRRRRPDTEVTDNTRPQTST